MTKPKRTPSAAKQHSQVEYREIMGQRSRFGPIGLHVYASDYLVSAR